MLQPHLAMSAPLIGWSLALVSFALFALAFFDHLRTPVRFAWNCFVKPFTGTQHGSADQRDRLDAFYGGQADMYDSTRTHLLKGRETMLQLLASHLKAQPLSIRGPTKPKIWVDIGGGTGWNIEKM